MAHTYEELSKMTVVRLREIGHGLNHPDLAGIATLHKDKLLPLLCHVMGIEDHAHREIVGIDKSSIKRQIRALKKEREAAMGGKDRVKLAEVRERIHKLKRLLRKSMR
jgi:protein-arginine kinase activator protein McsA